MYPPEYSPSEGGETGKKKRKRKRLLTLHPLEVNEHITQVPMWLWGDEKECPASSRRNKCHHVSQAKGMVW